MSETDLGPIDLNILNLAHQERLGYVRASDEWLVDGEDMPESMQQRCQFLVDHGFLPEFSDFFQGGDTP